MAPPSPTWAFLAYRLPREPSTPRITLWRKLRRLGAVQMLDGLVALPLDNRNRERLEWLAEEVLDASGWAAIWLAAPGSAAEERALAERMTSAIATEYRSVTERASKVTGDPAPERRRALRSLRRELAQIRRRDYFPPPEREQAVSAVAALAETLEAVAA